jgi:hypothetical protein
LSGFKIVDGGFAHNATLYRKKYKVDSQWIIMKIALFLNSLGLYSLIIKMQEKLGQA